MVTILSPSTLFQYTAHLKVYKAQNAQRITTFLPSSLSFCKSQTLGMFPSSVISINLPLTHPHH